MSTTERQNNLILNQDWQRIYQTFKQADFKSYDFENLRRVIIAYLRENYPEDFNDYIESSEYLALIDAIAFLGQSLAFRIDLASRENFLELAERKESVLRIAKMLSYNAKRNRCAKGLLKFTSVSTTEDIIDSNGRNLASQIVAWNDPTNANWSEQFILILNAAMADNTEFGRSQGNAVIQGISTEQYRFRTTSADVPLFTFNKSVAGVGMIFELVSTSIQNSTDVYEEAPFPGNQLGFIYKQDGKGPASPNTGFFLMFKQGSLEVADFTIDTPTTNDSVAVEADNINNDDLWLYSLNSNNAQTTEWTKVSSLIGNNIIYNSLSNNIRNIYAIETRQNDRVNLIFSDGVYGNLPQGPFRVFYRVSNGLSYTITPSEMKGITISFEYRNSRGILHTLTLGLGLQYTVSNASSTESLDSIKRNAPATFYTQNRMITGEDYNLAPLSSSQNVLKVKSINRTSSGISRNFEIIDVSGNYSDISVFADDGYIYKREVESSKVGTFNNRIEIYNFLVNEVEPVLKETDFYNFYLAKFPKTFFTDENKLWNNVTTNDGISTGYFVSAIDQSLLKVGTFTTNNLKYALVGSMIKFVPPTNKAFYRNTIVDYNPNNPEHQLYLWTKVERVFGDGTNAGRGQLSNGSGPIVFSDIIPTNSIARQIVPRFVVDFPASLENEIINQMSSNLNFGLRYDILDGGWKIITSSNLNLTDNFSFRGVGSTDNSNEDSSWLLAFVKESTRYRLRIRKLTYIFGSVQQNRFYFDPNEKQFNDVTGNVIKDKVKILSINNDNTNLTTLKTDIEFEISDTIKFADGYESLKEILVSFSDRDDDGVIDDPDSFERIAGEDSQLNYLFFQEQIDEYGGTVLNLIDNSNDAIIIAESENLIDVSLYNDGQLIYFYDVNEDRVKKVVSSGNSNNLVLDSTYRAFIGKRNLKFQYIHNANIDRRIDPSVSNIVDVFLLTRNYDTDFRNWLRGRGIKPETPTSDSLALEFGSTLNAIKSISDEIIYHPVKYKILFGQTASEELQASFKVVKNPNKTVNDNDLKVRIISAINEFFSVNNWDFGDRFYLSEMNTFILNRVAPDISNFTLVPTSPNKVFGSLFEIQSNQDEIFVSGATVDNIEIVPSINAAQLGIDPKYIVGAE